MIKNGFQIEERFGEEVLIKYTGTDEIVKIPEGIVALREAAFKMNKTIKEVYFPKSLRAIEPKAFAYCDNLKTVHFNEGLVQIGSQAFIANAIESFKMPSTLEYIGFGAFTNCWIKDITFSDKLISIPAECFDNNMFEEIIIPDNIISIESEAFASCKKLKKVILPKNLKQIGISSSVDGEGGTFECCTSLEEIVIPASLEGLTMNTFFNCTNLKKVTFTASKIDYIDDNCFDACKSLTEISIPTCKELYYNIFDNTSPNLKIYIDKETFDLNPEFVSANIKNIVNKNSLDALASNKTLKEINKFFIENNVER